MKVFAIKSSGSPGSSGSTASESFALDAATDAEQSAVGERQKGFQNKSTQFTRTINLFFFRRLTVGKLLDFFIIISANSLRKPANGSRPKGCQLRNCLQTKREQNQRERFISSLLVNKASNGGVRSAGG